MNSNAATDAADREIVLSREFEAPRELVWDAMTNPDHVVNWWGPRGFTTKIETMDVRPGGVWKHTMIGPDGTRYPNKSVFREVVRPGRIVYSHGGGREEGPGATFVATWTFEALAADRTRVTIRMVFTSASARDFVIREFGAIEGGKQTLERLGEHLASRRGQSLQPHQRPEPSGSPPRGREFIRAACRRTSHRPGLIRQDGRPGLPSGKET